ncbi:MAG: type II toxin-antitoxin system RelE/ParE family toxin [Defluviitaleaceae bacterium]|nr:type II toxin-antitoxin system RelE/ParE family toxin [Defluviitaleaceae bacterium]
MKISISSAAKAELRDIKRYLSKFGDSPPEKFMDNFEKFCSKVVDMPYMFSEYSYDPSYRKAPLVFDYVIFYKVYSEKNTIHIYRILHSRRDLSSILD